MTHATQGGRECRARLSISIARWEVRTAIPRTVDGGSCARPCLRGARRPCCRARCPANSELCAAIEAGTAMRPSDEVSGIDASRQQPRKPGRQHAALPPTARTCRDEDPFSQCFPATTTDRYRRRDRHSAATTAHRGADACGEPCIVAPGSQTVRTAQQPGTRHRIWQRYR